MGWLFFLRHKPLALLFCCFLAGCATAKSNEYSVPETVTLAASDQSATKPTSDGWTPSERIKHDGGGGSIDLTSRTGVAPISGFNYHYFADGTGSVDSNDEGFDHISWDIDCRKDKMTDRRKCVVSGPQLAVVYGESVAPQAVCAFKHDFPGRHGAIRIDNSPPVATSPDGCIRSKNLIAELQKGKKAAVRIVKWPYDENRDSEQSLAGLDDAMQLAQFLHANLDHLQF